MKKSPSDAIILAWNRAVIAATTHQSINDFEGEFDTLLVALQMSGDDIDVVQNFVLARFLNESNWCPWELAAFLMHELRWEGVKEALSESLLQHPRGPRRKYILTVLASFEDCWPDRDLFCRFRSSKNSAEHNDIEPD